MKLRGSYAHFVVSVFGIAAVAEFDKSITTRVESSKFLSVLFSTVCTIDRREGRRTTTNCNCHFSSFARERKLAWNTNEGFSFSRSPYNVQRGCSSRVNTSDGTDSTNSTGRCEKNSLKERLTDLQLHG